MTLTGIEKAAEVSVSAVPYTAQYCNCIIKTCMEEPWSLQRTTAVYSPRNLSYPFQILSQTKTLRLKALHGFLIQKKASPFTGLFHLHPILLYLFFPLFVLPPHWPSRVSVNTPHSLKPQGLCPNCFLYLESSYTGQINPDLNLLFQSAASQEYRNPSRWFRETQCWCVVTEEMEGLGERNKK